MDTGCGDMGPVLTYNAQAMLPPARSMTKGCLSQGTPDVRLPIFAYIVSVTFQEWLTVPFGNEVVDIRSSPALPGSLAVEACHAKWQNGAG